MTTIETVLLTIINNHMKENNYITESQRKQIEKMILEDDGTVSKK